MDCTTAGVSGFTPSSIDVASAQASNAVELCSEDPSDNNFGEPVQVFPDDEGFLSLADSASDPDMGLKVTKSDFTKLHIWPFSSIMEHEIRQMRPESSALFLPSHNKQVDKWDSFSKYFNLSPPSSTTSAKQTTDKQERGQRATPRAAPASTTEQVDAGSSSIDGKVTAGSPSKEPLKGSVVMNHADTRPVEVAKTPPKLSAQPTSSQAARSTPADAPTVSQAARSTPTGSHASAVQTSLAAIVAANNAPNATGSRSGEFFDIPTAPAPSYLPGVEQPRCGRAPHPVDRTTSQLAVHHAAPASTRDNIEKVGARLPAAAPSPAPAPMAGEVIARSSSKEPGGAGRPAVYERPKDNQVPDYASMRLEEAGKTPSTQVNRLPAQPTASQVARSSLAHGVTGTTARAAYTTQGPIVTANDAMFAMPSPELYALPHAFREEIGKALEKEKEKSREAFLAKLPAPPEKKKKKNTTRKSQKKPAGKPVEDVNGPAMAGPSRLPQNKRAREDNEDTNDMPVSEAPSRTRQNKRARKEGKDTNDASAGPSRKQGRK